MYVNMIHTSQPELMVGWVEGRALGSVTSSTPLAKGTVTQPQFLTLLAGGIKTEQELAVGCGYNGVLSNALWAKLGAEPREFADAQRGNSWMKGNRSTL